jgi:hypothetical protein
MSWTQLIQVSGSSPPIKKGNITGISDGVTTITFSTSFSGTDYIVSITPLVDAVFTMPPQACVIYDETFTSEGFQVQTVNANGFFWTAIYGSSS